MRKVEIFTTSGIDLGTQERWAELDSSDPKLGTPRDSRKASWLNDHGLTFAKIADRIEKYL